MATKARIMSAPLTQASRSPQGVFGQAAASLTQPKTFFRRMPQSRQWLLMAGLVLVIFGFAASNQAQSDTTSSDTPQTQGFDLTLLQGDTAAQTTNISTQATATPATDTVDTSEAADANTTLMSALLAACNVLAMWAGQVILLCVIPMLSGHPPRIGRSLQIAVWASLPLALMLALRQIYFAAGGTGGALGLSLLLEQWDGYAPLPSGAQRLLAAFMSNISVFWLWSLVLLYCGARYTLRGKYWSATLLIVIWVVAVPAVTALVGEPVTTVSPRTTTTQTTEPLSSDESGSSSTTAQPIDMGGNFPGGGQPPSGGMPPGSGQP
jgi:hypothetical protein